MTTFYVSPVCSPTRACLMTGRYNYRTRCIDTYVGRSMMDPDETTIAELLSRAGYATGVFGKWHLGDCYPMRAIDQGFQEALVHRGGGLAQPSEPRENKNRYTNPVLFHNGQQVQTTGYCADVYFHAALGFIEKSHAEQKNFFAYIATNTPHDPFHDVPAELLRHYQTKTGRAGRTDRGSAAARAVGQGSRQPGAYCRDDHERGSECRQVVRQAQSAGHYRQHAGDVPGGQRSEHTQVRRSSGAG